MGIRFNKSIKLGSLLKLNISKSGVSVTAGKKGASINLGKNGTYLNLSPSILGISGTGLSYRQKITGGVGSLTKKVADKIGDKKEEVVAETIQNNTGSSLKKNDEKPVEIKKVEDTNNIEQKQNQKIQETNQEVNVIEEYNALQECKVNIHKHTENVLSKADFEGRINNLENEASKEIYKLLISGDEDTIESTIGAFLNNLDLAYEVKCNYELEDNVLYVDLDLPEIENVDDTYLTLLKDEIVTKKKTIADLRQEYARTVMSLGVYLSANFFNLSSYIDQVTLSAFTSRRNNDGDLVDDYLYSIKFTRDKFINTNLEELEDLYKFILEFENRINVSSTYVFKAIKPYESPTVTQVKTILDDAINGLKELGYKASDIQRIMPSLTELKFETAGEYIKEALKLLSTK